MSGVILLYTFISKLDRRLTKLFHFVSVNYYIHMFNSGPLTLSGESDKHRNVIQLTFGPNFIVLTFVFVPERCLSSLCFGLDRFLTCGEGYTLGQLRGLLLFVKYTD